EYQISFNAPVVARLADAAGPPGQHDRAEEAEALGTVSQSAIRYNQVLVPGHDSWFSFSTPKIQDASAGQAEERGVVRVGAFQEMDVSLYRAADPSVPLATGHASGGG